MKLKYVAVALLLLASLAAMAPGAEAAHLPGATYSGTTSEGGTITLAVSDNGATVRVAVKFVSTQVGCPDSAVLDAAPITDHAFSYSGQTSNSQASFEIAGSFASGGRVSGRFTAQPPVGTPCVAHSLTFEAAAPTRGTIIAGGIPAQGFGLFVFGGGTEAQLLNASGCPPSTAAFWVTDGGGDFIVLIPASTVSAVNARWRAMFPTEIPPNTAMVGRCR